MMKFWQVSGSVDPTNMRARTRTPVEVKWHNMAKFDHDFIGREALSAEMANPKRTTVTLRWNPDDVIDTYASLLRPGNAYKPIDLPYAPQRWPMAHADHVVRDGREIGYSSGTIYSFAFREFLSLGCLDIDVSNIGNEVVQWGDHGGPIKDIRATIQRFSLPHRGTQQRHRRRNPSCRLKMLTVECYCVVEC
jgi:vanillate/3-O-methylgallate O-demethylase